MPSEMYGLELSDLPEDFQPLEAVVLVKCLTPDGVRLVARYTEGLYLWDVAGMASYLTTMTDKQLREATP